MPGSAQAFPVQATLADDHGHDLDIYQCQGCGLVQLNSPPVSYYREVIRATAYSAEMGEFRRRQFSQWIDQYQLHKASFLEVGCGRGEYLSLLREAGINATGIEYATDNVKACRASGLPVTRQFPSKSTTRLSASAFNAFACFNFMEHWPDPVASLQAIRNNLTPDGIGFIEVPNFNMILEKALYSEFISDHLSYFTADTLRFTLQMAGFDIIECRPIWQNYILSAVVRKRPVLDVTTLSKQAQQMRQQLHAFIAGFPAGQVAVWGAGHQALASIALSEIGPLLRYVIDSAPFKQGKYTPASHLPIVAPTHLDTEPVSAIIVMAAAYSDEVARQIRAHFPASLAVRILRDDKLEVA